MSKTKHLTREQIRKLLFAPLSDEAAKQYREIDESDKWLLALNFREMDCEKTEPDDEKED